MCSLQPMLPWEDLHFGWEAVREHQQDAQHLLERLPLPLPYMLLDKFDASKADLSRYEKSLRPEDRWILSRVNSLAEDVRDQYLSSMSSTRIMRSISEFILEDFSRWYIQLVLQAKDVDRAGRP